MPTIAVGVPCRDNSTSVATVLESVRLQVDPVDEVILVDDNSSHNESMSLQELARSYHAAYLRLPPPRTPWEALGRRSHARNAATVRARSEVILYLDGDMLLAPRYVEEIRHYHLLDRHALVRGERRALAIEHQQKGMRHCLRLVQSRSSLASSADLRYLSEGNTPSPRQEYTYLAAFALTCGAMHHLGPVTRREFLCRTIAAIAVSAFGAGVVLGRDNGPIPPYSYHWDWCASNNLSVRREHVLQVGLWDENFLGWGEEDVDFAYRLWRMGLRPILPRRTEAVAYHLDHPVDGTLARLSLLRNAQYLVNKFPELAPRRRDAYRRYGLTMDEITGASIRET